MALKHFLHFSEFPFRALSRELPCRRLVTECAFHDVFFSFFSYFSTQVGLLLKFTTRNPLVRAHGNPVRGPFADGYVSD